MAKNPTFYKEYDKTDEQFYIHDHDTGRLMCWTTSSVCAEHVLQALNQFNREKANVIQLESRYDPQMQDGLYYIGDRFGANRIVCWASSDWDAGYITAALNRFNAASVTYMVHTVAEPTPKFNRTKSRVKAHITY